MNQRILKVLAVLISALAVVMLLMLNNGSTREDSRQARLKLKKPDVVTQVRIQVNNWNYVMLNNGVYMLDQAAGSAGGEFPRGSGHTIVYSGGFNMAVLKNINGTDVKVVTNVQPSDGGTQMRPGALTNSGVPFLDLVASDPQSQDNRVYYLTPDHNEANWPGDLTSAGAPAKIAVGQTWAVFNDRDTTRDLTNYTHSPFPGIGAEVVLESFAFDAGPAADAVFLKFTLVNKTNVSYQGAYLGVYMDPDVETFANDIVGCDTVLGLGFCYNGDNTDLAKSVGIDFLQGPVVTAASVDPALAAKFAGNTSVLVYDPVQNIFLPTALPAGQIWLGATSFVRYASGSAPNNDPETYNLIAGLRLDGTPKTGCGDDYKYQWPGNPVTTPPGCTNGVMDPALGGDVRMMHGVGPFTLNAGDKQEVWAAVIGANGANRLAAVAQLKTTDGSVQTTFDNGLVAPTAPAIPTITVTPLDGQVAITWDNLAEYSDDKYGVISGISIANGYSEDYIANDFQGYRVYRTRTGLPGSFERLAEFDIPDGITTVTNRKLSANGNITIEEVAIGTDNGLQYGYLDNEVTNGQQYYYSVTSFDAQPYIASPNTLPFDAGTINVPAGIPVTLESALTGNLVFVRPMKAVLGTTYNASVGDVTHTGPSGGDVSVEVIDPALVQAGTYSVKFIKIPADSQTFPLVGAEFLPATSIVYQVWLGTTLKTIGSRNDDPRTFYDANANGTFETGVDIKLDETQFGEDQSTPTAEASIVVDGIKIVVAGPSLDFTGFDVTANAGGVLDPPAAGAATFQGFPSSDPDLVNDQQVNGSFWFIGDWRSATATTGAFADFITNAVTEWAGWDFIVPSDFEYRFTATGQMGQYRNTTTQRPIPFEVWNASTGTQLLVDWLNDAGTGNFQLVNADHPASGGNNDPRTCRFYVTQPHDMSAGSGGYNTWLALNDNLAANYDYVIGRQVFVNWNGGDVAVGIYNQPLPEVGTIFRINTTKPNNTGDTFSFSGVANTVTTAKKELKKGLKDIKVVPNPYYAQTSWQKGIFDKKVKFINLPATCTIRIFTVSGDLVSTIQHNAMSNNDRTNAVNPLEEGVLRGNLIQESLAPGDETSTEIYDLRNPGLKLIASGMYIALIDAPGIGTTTVKFAVIQQEILSNNPDVR